jgi:hypothetical protein
MVAEVEVVKNKTESRVASKPSSYIYFSVAPSNPSAPNQAIDIVNCLKLNQSIICGVSRWGLVKAFLTI